MKTYIFLFVFIMLSCPIIAQQIISGKSAPKLITIKPTYERGLPPNLFVKLSFMDDNNNGILEALENAKLVLDISNQGKGPAQGLKVTVKDNTSDVALSIGDGQEISFIYPGKSVNVTVAMTAGMYVKSAEHKFTINVTEHFGYDMDPAYLMVNTYQFQEPQLAFSGLEIHDAGEGTSALIEDKQLQPGELVKVKLYVQNIGQNISKDTKYHIKSDDNNIFVQDVSGTIGDMGIGEVKEIWFTLSPNKRVVTSGKLPVYLDASNTYKRGEINSFQLPLELNKKPSEPNLVKVDANIEKLKTQIARFEYKSDRITANISDIINIRQVPPSGYKRPDAIGIIIGVEKYSFLAPAPYAANDADIVKDYFRNVLGIDRVLEFTNEKVNGSFFDNYFNPDYGELQKAINKGKTEVFVFYSGHGLPDKTGDKVYLIPSDGKVEALDRQGYELNTLYKSLDALGAKSVFIFMDACFSGDARMTESGEAKNLIAAKGARIKPQTVEPWISNPNFSVFSSSDFNETSLGFDNSETGLFTYYLCSGLQGKADSNGDKVITSGELFDYISSGVRQTSIKIRGMQSPQFNGNRKNILVTY